MPKWLDDLMHSNRKAVIAEIEKVQVGFIEKIEGQRVYRTLGLSGLTRYIVDPLGPNREECRNAAEAYEVIRKLTK